MHPPKPPQEQLQLLRGLWDTVSSVLCELAEWHRTPWAAVEVESLVDEVKRMAGQLRGLPKAVQGYEACRWAAGRYEQWGMMLG